MKHFKLFLLSLLFIPAIVFAQNNNNKRYLAGAVPTNDKGVVVFEKTFQVPGKSASEIYDALLKYTDSQLIHGKNTLPQSRYISEKTNLLALHMEEYLYFKKRAWVTHRTRFFYDILFHIKDNRYTVTMQRLHYRYEAEETPNSRAEDYRAEDWITDEQALNKKGKLRRVPGKFRRFTIDRKNEIFGQSALATGAKVKTRHIIVVDDE